MTDYLSIAIRVAILFFAGAGSHLALDNKRYKIAFLLLSIWLTFFRLTLYRVVSLQMGVFQHETEIFITSITSFLLSSQASNVTDLLILSGLIYFFPQTFKKRKE